LIVPSKNANLMNEIQNIISPFLIRRDYQLRNRTFSKQLGNGLIHLIEFGLAGSTSSFYGKFTVDLGIFIPELYSIFEKKEIPKKITTQHCEFVRRLPSLEEGIEDKWWDVNEASSSSNEIIKLLQKYGFSFLEELTTREKIYQAWQKNGNSIGLPPRGRLSIAIMLNESGDKKAATELFKEEIEDIENKQYLAFVKEITTQLGIKNTTI
jgi:hypothetical protein